MNLELLDTVAGTMILAMLFCAKELSTELREIEKLCKTYEYENCALVKAIVRKESSFNPNAFVDEKTGSYGLMMIQCSTAKDKRLKSPLKHSCDQLFVPKINIRYGIMYLRLIEDMLIEPTIENTLAAYNAGFDKYSKVCWEFSEDGSKCIKYKYDVRRCKNETLFRYPGFPPTDCFPGEYINQEYVWKTNRYYQNYKSREQI